MGVEAGNHAIEGDLSAYFADSAFQLAQGAPAIDKGVVVEYSGFDLDGEPHDAGAAPDPGADEFR